MGIAERCPDFVPPVARAGAEAIGELASGSFPESYGGVDHVGVATVAACPFPGFEFFALDLDGHFMRLTAIGDDAVPQSLEPRCNRLRDAAGIKGTLAAQG